MATSSSPITQVSQHSPSPFAHQNASPHLLTRLLLDLRGKRFEVDRETIMNLPESVLLCLFPNGLVLSRQSMVGIDDGDGEGGEEEEVYGVDFDPSCFQFILSFFKNASESFYSGSPSLVSLQAHLAEADGVGGGQAGQNPLYTKQAIIVLREELEYFTIPPKAEDGAEAPSQPSTDQNGLANAAMLELKKSSGQYLMDKKSIFTALQRNVNRENNVAEQHLIDMLCMSGFSRTDEWGFRSLEPSRCCISSIALVGLKTGITHSGTGGDAKVEVDYHQMATAQKLLLFWRKPARKCWWDGQDVDLPNETGGTKSIKLWSRRVWTLELSLI